MAAMDEPLRAALSRWLLSSDQVPTNLAETLTLSVTPHTLTAWRFQGMWRRAYSGQLGRIRERHEVVLREQRNPDGSVERIADGTRQKPADLTMVDIDGEESGAFDVVALEGAPPSPPSPGWFARSIRGADRWREVQAEPARWKALGVPLVDEVAEEGLKRALGRPEILSLERTDTFTPATTSQATATAWEVTGEHAGRPLRCVVGPDGTVWGDPPRTDAPLAAQSEASAQTLLIGAGYALAALVGLLVFVIPGLIVGAVGVLHVRHRLQARARAIEQRRAAQQPAVRALVDRMTTA